MSIADRVVLVTGATGGLDTVVVDVRSRRREARAGRNGRRPARGRCGGRRPGRGSMGTRRRRPDEGGRASAAVGAVAERLGGSTSSFTSSAGSRPADRSPTFADDDLRSMLDQHLWSTLNVARAVLPGMVEHGLGRIVAVTASTPPRHRRTSRPTPSPRRQKRRYCGRWRAR